MLLGVRWTAGLILLSVVGVGPAPGQQRQAAPATEEPEPVTLTTKDGVQLKATYFPSKAGKDAVPVVLLHDYKGSRHELHVYADFLQRELSAAVIVPDLRGHGESTQQQLPVGRMRELDAARLRRNDFANMVLQDMEAIRRFLVTQNDEQQLNLNKLAVVGAGMGASVGLLWTMQDWSAPPLTIGKQGQDVKALALISPEWSFNGLSVAPAINHPLVRSRVALFVAYGERDSGRKRDAERIHKIAERFHPPFDPSEGKEREVVLFPRDTSRQGGEIFPRDEELGIAVRDFIESRVVKQDFPWTKRKLD